MPAITLVQVLHTATRAKFHGVVVMLDFLMIAYGVGFFAVSLLYVLACEKM